MDFAWSDEQIELHDAVVDFARRELGDDLVARDHDGGFDRAGWSACAAFGIQGMAVPEDLGGTGQSIMTTMLALEGLGFACPDNGLVFSINAQMWAVQAPILEFGTPEQKDRYLPRLCSGEWIGAHGMSEPDSGSDAFALRTTARRDGDRYVLNGVKTWVSNAPEADVFVVFATLDPAMGALGVTGFILERGMEGLSVGSKIEKMGLRTSPMADVIMEDCVVPVTARLGREGRGAGIFNAAMAWERTCILANVLGAMQRQLDTCVTYARTRRQFDKPIGAFQAVSHRLARMKLRLEGARLLLYRAAWLKQRGETADAEAAMAKAAVSDAYVASSLDAIMIHGGYGYSTEFELEREMRDAIGSKIYSGTTDIQHAIIARSLGF